jgi:hypothetical protein
LRGQPLQEHHNFRDRVRGSCTQLTIQPIRDFGREYWLRRFTQNPQELLLVTEHIPAQLLPAKGVGLPKGCGLIEHWEWQE